MCSPTLIPERFSRLENGILKVFETLSLSLSPKMTKKGFTTHLGKHISYTKPI